MRLVLGEEGRHLLPASLLRPPPALLCRSPPLLQVPLLLWRVGTGLLPELPQHPAVVSC